MAISVRGLLDKVIGPKGGPLEAQIAASVAKVELQVQLKRALIDLVSAQHQLEQARQDTTDYRDKIALQAKTALQLQADDVSRKCQAEMALLDNKIKEMDHHLRELVKKRVEVEIQLLGTTPTQPWTPPLRATVPDEEPVLSGAFFAAAPIVTARSRPSALAEHLVA